MEHTNKPIMALTYGDAAGIGPELVAKAMQSEEIRRIAKWVLVGDERVFRQGEQIAGVSLECEKIDSPDGVRERDGDVWMIDLRNLSPDRYQLGVLSPEAGRNSGEILQYVLQQTQKNLFDGVVYAPLNKEAISRGGLHFIDDIQFFADLLQCKDGYSEINVMDKLWITRVTSHIPLKDVSAFVTKERVGRIIRFAHETLRAVGFEQPRIAVAALNPHAGDGGKFGTEEIDAIIPAVEEARRQGILADGPFPADTIFLRLNTNPFDCLVAMYHDQAQIGMKLLGFQKGVTLNGGLPVVLATPAHGTAFDIAGKGVAECGAMLHAMRLAVRLVKQGQRSDKDKTR